MPNTVTSRNFNKTSITPDTANSMRKRDFLFLFSLEVMGTDTFWKCNLAVSFENALGCI